MTDPKMRVRELDFSTARENFKEFLRDQDEFSDYDLTQSGLDVLINLMAYGIHYDAFQANFSNSEMFLESAQLRRNAVSRAKHLMYVPKSVNAARLTANVYAQEQNGITLPSTLFLPKGSKFVTKSDEYKDIVFVTTEAYVANKVGDSFTFSGVSMYQGSYSSQYAEYDGVGVTIPSDRADTRFVEVLVMEQPNSSEYAEYTRVDDILSVKGDSRVYYLEEDFEGKYRVYFGDGVLGKSVPKGTQVLVTYIVTDGEEGNGMSVLQFAKSPREEDEINDARVTASVTQRSSGGAPRETVESIKFNAPRYFATQRVILNDTDAGFTIPRMYNDIRSVNVWSGKGTGAFGKTYISLNPYEDNLSDQRVAEILAEVEKRRFIILTDLVHVRPTYIDLGIKLNVYFTGKSNLAAIRTDLYDRILKYSEDNIEDFKKNFISNKFTVAIQTDATLEYDFSLDIKYRMPVFVNAVETYDFDFKNELTALKSSDFTWQGGTTHLENVGSVLWMVNQSGDKIKAVGSIDLSSGKGTIEQVNFQAATGNTVKLIGTPKRESIFGRNNNILRILEEDIEITYEIKN